MFGRKYNNIKFSDTLSDLGSVFNSEKNNYINGGNNDVDTLRQSDFEVSSIQDLNKKINKVEKKNDTIKFDIDKILKSSITDNENSLTDNVSVTDNIGISTINTNFTKVEW